MPHRRDGTRFAEATGVGFLTRLTHDETAAALTEVAAAKARHNVRAATAVAESDEKFGQSFGQ